MLFATIVVLLIIFVITVYYYYKFYCTAVKNDTRVPGPKPEWFFGNLRNTGVTSGRTLHEVFKIFQRKYGDSFSLWLGPYYTIVISSLENVQHVLKDRQTYDISTNTTKTFGVLFPNGLIALRGDDWKRHARFMLPMFKRAKVLPYLDTISTCIDRFIDERFVERDRQIHSDLVVQCQNFLLNIIALIAFDYDLGSSTQTGEFDLRKAFNDFVNYGSQFILLTGIPIWLGKLILAVNWKYQRALRIMKHYVMNIITEEQKRQQDESISSNRPKNLIASLVSSVKNESTTTKAFLTPEEVFDEVSMSVLAGFETTSAALSWFIFYMSKYPDVQKKIKDELQEKHLFYDTPLTQDLLDSLIYVECVTKEVLRCAPVAGQFAREATRDDIMNDIPIKKGDIILIAVQNLHEDPRYWKVDPTQFIPERFLNEDKNPPQYAYMPFGGGHRACAGQDLAFFELKVAITRLMQRVTFEDPGDLVNNTGGFIQRIGCYPKHLAVRVRIDSDRESD
jgi:cytochrome P450